MEKHMYVTPRVEVVVLETESLLLSGSVTPPQTGVDNVEYGGSIFN